MSGTEPARRMGHGHEKGAMMVKAIVLVGLLAAATIAVVMVAPVTLKSMVDDPAPVDELPEPAVLLPNTDPSPAVDDQPADVATAVVPSGPLPTTGSVPLPLVGVTLAAGLGALTVFAYLFFVKEG